MEKKVRVLHVAQASGGVERYLQMLLKHVKHNKIENILICSFDYKPEMFEGLVDGFEQIEMQRSIGKHDFKSIIEVRRLIKLYNPDIVYAHSSKAGALVRIANIGIKNKCIYNPHGWAFNMRCSNLKKMFYIGIERILAPFCNKIVCISEAEKRSALQRKICKEKKLQVVYNGIDIQKYKEREPGVIPRKELAIPEDAFVVGMVGRLSEQKAPDVFMHAANVIKKKIPNAFFVIVGSGELQKVVYELAGQYDLKNELLVTGWVDEPMNYIEQFNVAMLTSRWEGFGLVLPEYMLAKKPIVATSVDAIPDIVIDGKTGLLVEVDDYQAVAEAVVKIYGDSTLANELCENGLKSVHARFDIKRVAEEHEEIFLHI